MEEEEMFLAEEAKKITTDAHKVTEAELREKDMHVLNSIFDEIKKASREGKDSIIYEFSFLGMTKDSYHTNQPTKELITTLKTLGYEVKCGFWLKLFNKIKISWGNKNEK